jgi:MFS family permease
MVVASALSAFAVNLIVLDVARVLAGIAAAANFTSATAIMSNASEPAARQRNFGFLGTVLGLGLALGPAKLAKHHVPGRKLVDFALLRNPHFLAISPSAISAEHVGDRDTGGERQGLVKENPQVVRVTAVVVNGYE